MSSSKVFQHMKEMTCGEAKEYANQYSDLGIEECSKRCSVEMEREDKELKQLCEELGI